MKTIKQVLKELKEKYKEEFIFHLNTDEKGVSLFIMEKEGRATARIYWFNEDIETICLDFLSVDESIRKKGFGTKLQEIRENIGKELGFIYSYLWVKKNSWMRDWYRRRGYSDWGLHETEKDCIWMYKSLN